MSGVCVCYHRNLFNRSIVFHRIVGNRYLIILRRTIKTERKSLEPDIWEKEYKKTSTFSLLSKEKLRFIERLKKEWKVLISMGKESIKWTIAKRGKFHSASDKKVFRLWQRHKKIDNDWRTSLFRSHLIGKRGKQTKINKKTIIFNRNLCFFPALLSLATFMLSINFHFLLFGHSLDCLTSIICPPRSKPWHLKYSFETTKTGNFCVKCNFAIETCEQNDKIECAW